MAADVFKRKIYEELLDWKKNYSERYALLVQGARRVGKSTVVRAFAEKEFRSYILIDFANTSKEIIELFEDTYNLNFFFLQLQQLTGIRLYEGESVIIFDEIQLLPKARQAIKYLVADGRYSYMETGSLISLRKNTRDILIPSEERKVSMYPMDFEEFLWAVGDEVTVDTIRTLMGAKRPAGNALHRNLMRSFRLYMLIGGMPQAVLTYLEKNNLQLVDETKREIISLYEEDFAKIDVTGLAGDVFDAIPANLSTNSSRYLMSGAGRRTRKEQSGAVVADMLSSYTVNISYRVSDPAVGLSQTKDYDHYKLFTADTGLFVTLAFKDKKYTDNEIYNKLLSDKLEANLGYVYENMIAQILVSKGSQLFYHTMESETSHHLYEVDFLLTDGPKIDPIEVKSSNYRKHASLERFMEKYSGRIRQPYVFHAKDYKREKGIIYLPVYMVPFL